MFLAAIWLFIAAGSSLAADTTKPPRIDPTDKVKPTKHSEDVPKLDGNLPDVPPEKKEPERKNQRPVINSVVVYPDQDSIVAGYPTLTHNLMPAYATITVNASDPDGDYPLKYVMLSSGTKKVPNDHLNVAYIPANKPSINDKGMYIVIIQVVDSRGAKSDPVINAVAVLDPYDDEFNEKYKKSVEEYNSKGYLTDSLPPALRVFSRSGATKAPTPTAQILDSAAPWQNVRVQQCVRDYLNQVAFPVENRLAPGRYTHIDDWGRILGPNLKAQGGVDGNWDNPTHFVWSQYNSQRVTERYGKSLRDYVVDCLDGLAAPPETAAVPPATGDAGPGLVTGPDAREAFEALRRSNLVTFFDMENIPTGIHNSIKLANIAVTLKTTEIRYPLPPRNAPESTPIAMLPYSFVNSPANHRLMGVREGNIPDGQSRYELVLSEPTIYVGLMRNWNTNSLTRFYNEAGTLLAEHRNKTNQEFVGYVADQPENRVHRIEFDGIPSEPTSTSNKIFQVGEVDDLYLGNQIRPTTKPATKPRTQSAMKPAQPDDGPRSGGNTSLNALYRGLDADVVGSMGKASPDGRMDGHFTLTLDTGGEEKEVGIIMVQSARDDGQPTNLRWDTMPGGNWILGVYREGQRLNPTDMFLKDIVRGVARYEVYGNAEDAQWFRGGSNFRVTIRFKDRQEVVAFARVRGGELGGAQAAGEATLTAVFRGMGPEDRVGTWWRGTPNGEPDGHFTLTLDTGGVHREVKEIIIRSAGPGGLRWDTMPSTGNWILGTYRDGRRLNPTDIKLSDVVENRAVYEAYGNAETPDWFRFGEKFRVTVNFADGGKAETFVRVTTATAGAAGSGDICGDHRTQATMDEWLARAIPPQQSNERLRYEPWGRVVGQSSTAILTAQGKPDTPLDRCHWLLQYATDLTSTNLGTLKQYLQNKLGIR